jgi:hypothetical protein
MDPREFLTRFNQVFDLPIKQLILSPDGIAMETGGNHALRLGWTRNQTSLMKRTGGAARVSSWMMAPISAEVTGL